MLQDKYYRVDYQLERENAGMLAFSIEIDKETHISRASSTAPAPDWARMAHERCEGCTLPDSEFCPIALRIAPAVEKMKGVVSHERVTATVITPERSYVKQVDAQDAIRSLFGLIMATSGCPSMRPFRYMARYHLPFSTIEETIARIVSTHLLHQLFTHPQPDTDTPTQLPFTIRDVEKLYQTMQKLNDGMVCRLKSATMSEGSVNAVIILSAYSSLIPLTIDKEMRHLRRLFTD